MLNEANFKKFFIIFLTAITGVFTGHGATAQVHRQSITDETGIEKITVKELAAETDASPDVMNRMVNKSREIYTNDPENLTAGLQHYSLKKCYDIALEKNTAVKQAQNNIKANKLDRKTAQYNLLPSVNFDLGHDFFFGKNIDPVTNVFSYESFSGGYTTLALDMGIFSGFRKINAIKQSASIVKSAEYNQKKIELELLTNITLTYARLLLAKDELEDKRDIIQNTLKELDVINEKIKVGRLSKYEFYTFNARHNTEQADLVTLQNDSLAALQDLRQLMNISYKERFDVASINEEMLADIYETNISEASLIESILTAHPAIRQAKADEQAARVGVKIAKSNFLPALSAGGNLISNYNSDQTGINGGKIPVPRQLNDNLGKNINISLHIPIFSQMQNLNLVRKEKLNISNAQMDVENAKNSITTNVLNLINDFNSSKEKYKATLSAFEQNKLSYSLYQEKYKLGQISSIELITAQEILNSAASRYIEAKLQLFFRFQLIELLKKYARD